MQKNIMTHFGAVVLLHLAVLFGSWQIVKDMPKTSLKEEYAPGILRVKMGARVLSQALTQSVVQKPLPTPAPTKSNPLAKTSVKTAEAAPATQMMAGDGGTDTVSSAGKRDGTIDGLGAGSGTLKISYKDELRARIDQNKFYPAVSRRLGQTGVVVVAFTLLEDGNIVDVRIDKPSPFERLNLAGLEAVKKVERFKPIPKELGETKMDIKVPVKFFTI